MIRFWGQKIKDDGDIMKKYAKVSFLGFVWT